MADILQTYDPRLGAIYSESAIRAMEWSESQPRESDYDEALLAQRSVAAASLFKLTGQMRWHEIFVESTSFASGVNQFLSCHEHTHCDAGWIYLSTDPSLTDSELRSTIEESFFANAEQTLASAASTAFGWTVENPFVPLVWGLGSGGSPSSIGLLRAHALSGDDRFLTAALRSAAVTLGANPTNTSFVTGVGRNPVGYPLVVDTMNGGLPVWAGTPVYGYHQMGRLEDDSWVDEFVLEPVGVQPLSAELPYMWQWFDVPDVATFNESTVFQSHAEALYAFSTLGALRAVR